MWYCVLEAIVAELRVAHRTNKAPHILDFTIGDYTEYALTFSQCLGDEVISRRKVHVCGIGF
ncbi:hypothetical protein ANAPRD1_00346 [Anaplasma phagocytophilum]|nr:hypothetical protein ANAPRD1_00346 [Anaplasma phagocytophilum]SCV64876.1 hypothetical protein ANAPH2_01096 [Anaplasma phagocytophilum]SCV66101.1 hypothetical protein ANAPH1_00963 [Anaplasma phagocytophilum]